MRTFKLLVRDSGDPSLRILKYFDKHIADINKMGVKLQIAVLEEKDLDKEMVDELASRGITRVPTLITDNQKLFVGPEKIRDLFDKSLQTFKRQNMGKIAKKSSSDPRSTEFGTNPELSAYWYKYMCEDKGDECEDITESKKDIDRRLREYQPPAHRDAKRANRDVDTDMLQRGRRGNTGFDGRQDALSGRGASDRMASDRGGSGRMASDRGGSGRMASSGRGSSSGNNMSSMSKEPRENPDDEENIIVEPVGSNVVDTLSQVEHEENDPRDDLMERAMWEGKSGGFDPGQ